MGTITAVGTILAGSALNEQSLGRIDEATTTEAKLMDFWFVRHIGYIESIAADLSNMSDISPEALLPSLISHNDLNDDYFSVYVGYSDGGSVFSDEWIPDNGWVATERDWYKSAVAAPNSTQISELYADADTGNLCITLSKAFSHNGDISGVVAIDIFINVLHDIVSGAVVAPGSYALLTDAQGNIIVHNESIYAPAIDADGEEVFQNIAEIENNIYSDLRKPELLSGGSIHLRDLNGDLCYYSASVISSNGCVIYTVTSMKTVNAPIRQQIIVSAILFTVVLFVAALLMYFSLRRLIMHPVKDVTDAANLLACGKTGVCLDGKYIGEIALLADSFRGMEAFNRQQTEWLECIANGDLSIEIIPRGENDRIGHAIGSMLENLNKMFLNISKSTDHVSGGSRQIADGAQSLAQSSTQQAASIEQLSSAVAEITERTQANASKAEQAAKLADTIRDSAEKGSCQMSEMIDAVKEINEASHSIIKVIKTIDNIAFQTNILALNAAVEAARAGHRGKGFAVVADEVRNLAAKSAKAADETGALLRDSMQKTELGSNIAAKTAASLNEIVSGINESNHLISEIAMVSEGQSLGIGQINIGIDQVAQAVSQNSATAEQSAAASEEMSLQTSLLQELISQFKLKCS